MNLKSRINEDMKTAMKAREAARLGAIRLLLAAIKQKEVDERIQLDDAAVLAVIDKMAASTARPCSSRTRCPASAW